MTSGGVPVLSSTRVFTANPFFFPELLLFFESVILLISSPSLKVSRVLSVMLNLDLIMDLRC